MPRKIIKILEIFSKTKCILNIGKFCKIMQLIFFAVYTSNFMKGNSKKIINYVWINLKRTNHNEQKSQEKTNFNGSFTVVKPSMWSVRLYFQWQMAINDHKEFFFAFLFIRLFVCFLPSLFFDSCLFLFILNYILHYIQKQDI